MIEFKYLDRREICYELQASWRRTNRVFDSLSPSGFRLGTIGRFCFGLRGIRICICRELLLTLRVKA